LDTTNSCKTSLHFTKWLPGYHHFIPIIITYTWALTMYEVFYIHAPILLQSCILLIWKLRIRKARSHRD
jgi:hypothetical protein